MEDFENEMLGQENEDLGDPTPPDFFSSLEGVLGAVGARHFRRKLKAKPPEHAKKAEEQMVNQANLVAKITEKVVDQKEQEKERKEPGHPHAAQDRGELSRIKKWAGDKGHDASKLKIESVRWFHKRVIDLANVQARYPYFGEVEKPGPFETNMQMWGEWPQTTLVILKGILATVHLKTFGTVDPNAAGYISMVDHFLNNSTFKYKIDQSESVPILLKNLPAGGGAFAVQNESNGWPIASNVRMLKHPVHIEGGIQFFSELDVDPSAFTVLAGGPPPVPTPMYPGAQLYVTMELDATWVRHTG